MSFKLTILQTVLPDYRKLFFEHLKQSLGQGFELYAGKYYFENSVKTDERIAHQPVKNSYLLGKRFLWQRGVGHLASEEGVVVLEMNPRILSNWYLLITRKLTKRNTVLWGHAWPRKGKEAKSDILRHQMRKLATSIVVYTEQQRRELAQKMKNTSVFAAPNALMNAETMTPVTENPKHIIYVGRLTKGKKVMFLVEAFKELGATIPPSTQLIIVGDGEERAEIAAFITENQFENKIRLLGHINNQETLRKLYASSIFSVSPGYVGLSITQSFGFGVPMLISKDEPHSPEIEAVILKENALFYETDDVDSFRESVKALFSNQEDWIERRPEISKFCSEKYTVEAMAAVFTNLVETYDG